MMLIQMSPRESSYKRNGSLPLKPFCDVKRCVVVPSRDPSASAMAETETVHRLPAPTTVAFDPEETVDSNPNSEQHWRAD